MKSTFIKILNSLSLSNNHNSSTSSNNDTKTNLENVNESNDRDLLLNLSPLLLQQILSHLYDIDLVSFVLVCKKVFNQRDKYIRANFISSSNDNNNNKNSNNKSIGSVITLPIKPENNNIDLYSMALRSIYVNNRSMVKLNSDSLLYFIPNINKDKLDLDINSIVNFNNFNESSENDINSMTIRDILKDREYSFDIVPYRFTNSNSPLDQDITFVLGSACNCKSSQLISNLLESPSEICYDMILKSDFLFNIRDLEMNIPKFINKLEKYHLPPYLERLSLLNAKQEFDSESFPSTLTNLRISGKNFTVVGLPPNLEELYFKSKYEHTISNDMLPLSLHTLKGICKLENAKDNRSLRKLYFDMYASTQVDINPLPDTLTDLVIPFSKDELQILLERYNNGEDSGVIPLSVERLHIYLTPINQVDVARENQPFSLRPLLKPSSLGNRSQLRSLIIWSYPILLDADSFAPDCCNSLVSLSLTFHMNYSLQSYMIPSTVKHLKLPYLTNNAKIKSNSIPETVESLDGLPDNQNLDKIPTTVRHLTLTFHKFTDTKLLPSLHANIQSLNIESPFGKFYLRRYDSNHFIFFQNRYTNNSEFAILSIDYINYYFVNFFNIKPPVPTSV